MKIKFLKLKSWLLAGVMGALGLSSCHCNKQLAEPEEPETPEVKDRGDVRLMYGVPTMNYMIRGQVRDDKGRPVRDVRVGVLEHGIEASADTVYGDPDNVRSYLENTSVKTDKHGRFELSGSSRPWDEMPCSCATSTDARTATTKTSCSMSRCNPRTWIAPTPQACIRAPSARN